jgi:hypothetical protein
VGLAVLACGLVVAPVASADPAASPATRYAKVRRVCPPPAPGRATCLALLRRTVAPGAAVPRGARPYALNAGAAASGPAGGLTPAQLASVYAYNPQDGGSGQTVAIIDAYDDPNIEKDLGEFDTHYGLAACTTANGCFTKVGQTGKTTSLPAKDKEGWSVEISLDVEAAHAVCPNCKILLVEADSSTYEDLAAAVNTAVRLGASEVSNSYGGPEIAMGATERAAYAHPGVVIAASTGDDGYDGWDIVNEGFQAPEMPSAPGSLPSVVSVGGTTLSLNPDGTRLSETVWNRNGPEDAFGAFEELAEGATGGGCSTLFSAEPWQRGLSGFATATGCGSKRLAADVSAVGDPFTGFDVYDSYDCGAACEEFGITKNGVWVTIGGTSLSTPIIAALYALAGGGGGLRDPALALYGHLGGSSSLYDVTEGGSGFCQAQAGCHPNASHGRVDCEGTTACDAAIGYDGPSGVGAPDGLGLFKPLLPTAVITAPSSLEAGVAASFAAGRSSDPYPGGSISSYVWGWGDGSPAGSGVSPTHTYASAGTYAVTLTVKDSYGMTSASAEAQVKVNPKVSDEEAKKKEEEEAKKKEEAATEERRHEAEAAETRKHEEEAAAARRQEEQAKALVIPISAPASTSAQGIASFQVQAPPPVPDARITGNALTASSSGALKVKISCPAGNSSCAGTVILRTLAPVAAGPAGAAKRKASILTLAAGSFSVAGGSVKTVKLQLSARARKVLARSRSLRVRATIAAHDAAGARHTTQAILTLRAPRARHANA